MFRQPYACRHTWPILLSTLVNVRHPSTTPWLCNSLLFAVIPCVQCNIIAGYTIHSLVGIYCVTFQFCVSGMMQYVNIIRKISRCGHTGVSGACTHTHTHTHSSVDDWRYQWHWFIALTSALTIVNFCWDDSGPSNVYCNHGSFEPHKPHPISLKWLYHIGTCALS